MSTSSSGLVSATVLLAGGKRCAQACGLLGDLRDLEGLRLLGRVRVLGAGVDLELAELLATQARLGDHPADGLLDRTLGVLLEQLDVADGPQTAGVAGVPVGTLLLALGARQR